MNTSQKNAIKNVIFQCGTLKNNDTVLILYDETTQDIAEHFESLARTMCPDVHSSCVRGLACHGEEPPIAIASQMLSASLILSLCQYSLAHSKARVNAGAAGARFLSLPLYDWSILSDRSLQADFKAQASIVAQVTQVLTEGKHVHVLTAAGTDITLDISGRVGNCCPGFVEQPGDLGSPPDIESNVSPHESASEGVVVIDGSITHPSLGLLSTPVKLDVSGGRITQFKSGNVKYVDVLNELFRDQDSPRRVLAELGIGLNPLASLTGTMLTDEGALGCVHFGFGSNYTVGGMNQVDFHLDFVFKYANLLVDGKYLLREGDLQL